MKNFALALFLGAAALFLAPGLAQSRQAQFSLSIAAAQSEVARGSETKISTTLTNLSGSAVTLEFKGSLCDYSVVVRDGAGHLAPDTTLKKSLDCADSSSGDIIATLKPHESFKDTIVVNASSDISQPG